MTITITQITNGTGLLINGEIFLVTENQHVKPGKGGAFLRAKLKSVRSGAVIDRTFRPGDKLEEVEIEEKGMQFLYHAGTTYHFMDHTSYEEMVIQEEDIADETAFLLENLEVTALVNKGKVIKITLPTFIEAQITETEPGIKGDSSRAGTKPAKIETGATIQVPLFVNREDRVKIDTRTGQYVERIQK